MSNARKLQTEIERCMKKVDEGVELFDEIWEKVYSAEQQNQKEKYEMDLKKEIKKLQRQRDQIKTWISSTEVKDKDPLIEARKLIESKMEQFKICEKETKTKTYSKEGLAREDKLDPEEEAKLNTTTWLGEYIDKFRSELEEKDFEIERLTSLKVKKSGKAQLDALLQHVANHKFHISKLEGIIRLVNNDRLDVDIVDPLREDLDYYLDSYQDEDYASAYDEDYFYESLGLDDLDLVNVDRVTQSNVSTSSVGGSNHKDSGNGSKKSDDATSTSSRGSKDTKKSAKKSSVSSVIPLTIGRARSKQEKSGGESNNNNNKQTTGKPLGSDPNDDKTISSLNNAASTAPSSTVNNNTVTTPSKISRVASVGNNNNTKAALTSPTTSTTTQAPATSMAAILKRESEQQEKERQQKLLREQQAKAQAAAAAAAAEQLRQQQQQAQLAAQRQQQEALRHQEALRIKQQQQQQAQAEALLQQQQQQSEDKLHQPDEESVSSSQQQQLQQQQQQQQQAEQMVAPPQQLQAQSQPQQHAQISHQQSRRATGIMSSDPGELNGQASAIGSVSASSSSSFSVQQQLSGIPKSSPNQTLGQQQNSTNNNNNSAIGILTSGLGGLGLGGSNPISSRPTNEGFSTSSSAVGTVSGEVGRLGASAGARPSSSSSYVSSALSDSFATVPHPLDHERIRQYVPQNPYHSTPPSYPTAPSPILDKPEIFEKLGTDALFFVFYYAQGSYQQYLAARELKKQSWRFHKKYMTWFQRHEEPQITTEEYEQGTYVYFD